MNLGGDPERDDFGLPPVDIEIPDDARELDRDVQAYRREQRALRRRQRRMRLGAPLTRDGVVLPLLASCLVLALIAGTLLTVFTAGPGGERNLPGATGGGNIGPPVSTGAGNGANVGASHSAAGGNTGAAGNGGGPAAGPAPDSPTATPATQRLPQKAIKAMGQRIVLTSLLASHSALVLALVPTDCRCEATARRLVTQVHRAGLQIYLVGGEGQRAVIRMLAAYAPGRAIVAEDVTGVLYRSYSPSGLTALLVQPNGTVSKAPDLSGKFVLTRQLGQLDTKAARAHEPSSSSAAPPAPSAPPGSTSPASTSAP